MVDDPARGDAQETLILKCTHTLFERFGWPPDGVQTEWGPLIYGGPPKTFKLYDT